MQTGNLEVVRAWVEDNSGRVLLIRRGPASYGGNKWEFPGGKLDEGEGVDIALFREMCEETGLVVTNLDGLMHRHERVIDSGKRSGETLNERVYWVEVAGGDNIVLDSRHIAYNWFSRQDLEKLDLSEDARKTVIDINSRS